MLKEHIKNFLSEKASVLIAPAGHGKTHFITECLSQASDEKPFLILTHTHAGIDSLKNKFQTNKIPGNKYVLETISGFSQRIVTNILGEASLPSIDDKNRHYFSETLKLCSDLLQKKQVKFVISLSYSRIFVDEYQDCTFSQHSLLMTLLGSLPLHLLGDPLQGIYNFGDEPLVDFDKDLTAFRKFNFLNTPWRWQSNNERLGRLILSMRNKLEEGKPVELLEHSEFDFYIRDFPQLKEEYKPEAYKSLFKAIKYFEQKNQSVLVIYPIHKQENGRMVGLLDDRLKLNSYLGQQLKVLDAIDENVYYEAALCAVRVLVGGEAYLKHFHDLLVKLKFNKSGLNNWLDRSGKPKNKRNPDEKRYSEKLKELFTNLKTRRSPDNLLSLLTFFASLPKVSKKHPPLYYSLLRALENSTISGQSIHDEMVHVKNCQRIRGNRNSRKCIGTTLLTKGLEFDAVIIWGAHRFIDRKNFYVAISRAKKSLVIYTSDKILSFATEENKGRTGDCK